MKLYYMSGACSLATHIVLEWIGASYDTRKLGHDQLKTDEFLAVNPLGAVPALALDDRVLTQNAAVLNYLAETHPDAGLLGDGTPEGRAEVNRWLGIVNSDMHPKFKPLFGATRYLDDEAAIEKTKVNAKQSLRPLFELADTQLKNQNWIAGTRSIADPYLYVMVRWAKMMKVDLSGLDNLARLAERMENDDAVRKVLADEGLA